MKQKLLVVCGAIFFLMSSVSAQGIKFERGFPSSSELEIKLDAVSYSSIAFSDIDLDGDQDLLVTGLNSSNERISKLYRNDGGVFTEVLGTNFEGVSNGSIAFSDIDGDTYPDLLITGLNSSNERISKLYRNDGGVFTEVLGTNFEGVSNGSIAFSDIELDGDQDVLITGLNSSSERISKLYRNDGNFLFEEVTEANFEGVSDGSIAFSDIELDGYQDVLITGLNSSNEIISKLYKNDGTGLFAEVAGTAIEGVVEGFIAFSDIDGDTYPDLLITGRTSSNEKISKLYRNDRTGGFEEVMNTPFEGVYKSSVAFSDIDGDEDLDVLITGSNSYIGISKLYINEGSGVFKEVTNTAFTGVSSGSIAFADVDGDDDQDVLITGSNSSIVYKNTNGVFVAAKEPVFMASKRSIIAFSDIDNDGDEDVLIGGNDAPAKLYNNVGGIFTEVTGTPFVRLSSSSITFSDIDGDTYPDVIIAGNDGQGYGFGLKTKLYVNNRMGGFEEVLGTNFEGVSQGSVTFSDIDGDGDQDVLITGLDNKDDAIAKLYRNNGNLDFVEITGTPFLGVWFSNAAFADVDGDGDEDLLIQGYNNNDKQIDPYAVTKLYTNTKGVFEEATGSPLLGLFWGSIAFADVDVDGDEDLMITGHESTDNPVNSYSLLYKNDGNGDFKIVTGTPFEAVENGSIAFADVDGNSFPDVLITGTNPSGEGISKLYSNEKGVFKEVMNTPFVGVKGKFLGVVTSVAFSDIDGDDDPDVLIAGLTNKGVNSIYLYRNTTTLNVPPTAICKDITVQLSAAGVVTILADDVDNGSRDVESAVSLSIDKSEFSCANVGTAIKVILTVTDNQGATDSCEATVTVEDKTAPVVVTKNKTIQLNASGTASIVAADVNNGSTDNCGISLVELDKTSFTCANVGDNTVILTVTDVNGNVASETAIVTVEDKTAPVVVTKNKTIQLNAFGTASIVAADVNDGSTDNCGISLVELDKTSFTCANVGDNTVTLKVTDVNGNVASETAIVTVEDKTAPVVVTKNKTIQLNAFGTASIVAADVNNGSTDNCGISLVELDKTSFTCANVGDNTVILTVTDVNGNVATQTATVTVEDKTAPVVVTKDITVELDVTGNVSIVAADVNNGSTDNCGINLLELDKTSFTCANVGDNTVTLKVTDVNGNVASETAIVTVEDKTAPVVVTKNKTIQLNASGTASIVAADVNNGSTDNCGISLVELDKTSFTCANVGDNTVILTVTDVNGNVATQTATVTVEDKTAPVVLIKDITVELDASSNITILASDVNNGSTDNCGISLLELDKATFSCGDVGDNTVRLKVTDNSGNVSTKTAIVTVVNTRPNLIRKHFDDVIFFDNSSKAFKGSGYSWYKNGVLVAGQTAQYFKDSGVLNGTYYAMATKTDGTLVMTCPLTFSASIKQEYLKIAPNPVKSNAVYQLITNVDSARLQNARITVFSTLGVLMNDKIVDSETIAMIAPTTEGIYIVKLTLANGTYFTKNLLVKN